MNTDKSSGKKGLLARSELSIWLDTYDDIFSDFDSRPYTDRALSDDFLNEMRKIVREKPGGSVELKLLIPTRLHNIETERIIIKNLHTHFHHAAQLLGDEMRQTTRRGYLFATLGLILMII